MISKSWVIVSQVLGRMHIYIYILYFYDIYIYRCLFISGKGGLKWVNVFFFWTTARVLCQSGSHIVHFPIPSMYGIFANIYHENQPNVGKYTIHGSYGFEN